MKSPAGTAHPVARRVWGLSVKAGLRAVKTLM
jgi:hypothetical protein